MNRPARRRNAAATRTEPMNEPATVDITGGVSADATSVPTEEWLAVRAAEDKPKSLLAQLREWLSTVADDHPYDQLAMLAREAGWDWLLRQSSVQAGENTIVVSFAVMIGRAGMDAAQFEQVDYATFALPAVPGPVSVAARAQINPTIIYMLFGRLPPTRDPANTRMAEKKVVVDMEDDDVELPDEQRQMQDVDIDPPVTGADVPPWTPGAGLPDVVAREDDGVPVLKDLDEVEAPSQDVIVAVTNVVNAALIKMTSVDQVLAMWNANSAAFEWLTDMATPEQRSAITGAFARRKGQIEAGYTDVAPRRRGVN